jgi:catechol 2,3-dioxygenase-like lactoylglutathione lyase family enzyme
MTIRLDHTIVPVRNRSAAAGFFADIFGLEVHHQSPFAQVRINDSLTFDFADDPDHGGRSEAFGQHYAFHVSDEEFDAIFERVQSRGLAYGSGPFSHTDGRINTRRGGRGFYFQDPDGHLLELMTVRETGTAG